MMLAPDDCTPCGSLQVNGETWQDELFAPVHKRPLGYVFQEAGRFRHLSVRANLEYGYKRIPSAESAAGAGGGMAGPIAPYRTRRSGEAATGRLARRSRDLLNLAIGMDVFAQVKSAVLTT